MTSQAKRSYASRARAQSAEETRERILDAARHLFGRKGIDAVTVADIATRAKVGVSTVYATFKSKDGMLRALMERSLFGSRFQAALALLDGVDDPVQVIARTAAVSRAIYEAESSDLGLIRHASGFSPALRKIEVEFDEMRLAMQAPRIAALFAAGRARAGLSEPEAARILWTLTSRDVYRMLVQESGWSGDAYQQWLSHTLVGQLVAVSATP